MRLDSKLKIFIGVKVPSKEESESIWYCLEKCPIAEFARRYGYDFCSEVSREVLKLLKIDKEMRGLTCREKMQEICDAISKYNKRIGNRI